MNWKDESEKYNLQMKVPTITKILIEEFMSYVKAIQKESGLFRFHDESKAMIEAQKEMILSLSTYEEIDNYLRKYRRLTLQEWYDSL